MGALGAGGVVGDWLGLPVGASRGARGKVAGGDGVGRRLRVGASWGR